ncbi:MAG: polyphosphate kinase 1 [Fimbriimonadaceae bacterium]
MARLKKLKSTEPQERPYLNRELSWLEFNRRVLAEAQDQTVPLLERAKFLGIFESNLDEFYMVRVSGLIEQFEGGLLEASVDGLSPGDQLEAIAAVAAPMRQEACRVWLEIREKLAENGVRVLRMEDLNPSQVATLNDYFAHEVFQVCTPLILVPNPSVPFISNRSLNLAVVLEEPSGAAKIARVKIPDVLPRFVRVGRRYDFVALEDLIQANLQLLFPGVRIVGAHLFRVLRDADVEIRELEAGDLIETLQETLRLRRFGDPVLLEVNEDMPEEIRKTLLGLLKLDESDCFKLSGLMGMDGLFELSRLDRATLKYKPHVPYLAEPLATTSGLFETIKKGDVLVHHPFDSFRTVENFVASAATDPTVIGIKQTLYRVGAQSPIVESLLAAAEAGKQVAVMVELKARFDEDNNMAWAKVLERAGVHVTYGFADLKTHCKLCLVVRREAAGLKSYAHLGTGNYNPATARTYTDVGLFTDDEAITQDVAELFNYLTGFSMQRAYRKLLVAPINLREGVLKRIEREIKHKSGHIILKLNSLVDPEMIDALYRAADSGVKVDLIIRGICCLRPRRNIRIVSIIGRFLEHSRILCFGNDGKPEVLIGSADLMRRNLDRRVEVLVPIMARPLVEHIFGTILETYLHDTSNAWELKEEGGYVRRESGKKPLDSQAWFATHPGSKQLLS